MQKGQPPEGSPRDTVVSLVTPGRRDDAHIPTHGLSLNREEAVLSKETRTVLRRTVINRSFLQGAPSQGQCPMGGGPVGLPAGPLGSRAEMVCVL